jgi:hypothetical protein
VKRFSIALLALATALAITPAALADTYDFTISSSGDNGSGVITVAQQGSTDVYEVTGITGTFSDATLGLTNAAITALITASYDSNNPTFYPGTGTASDNYPAVDDLFYPNGDAPGVSFDGFTFPAIGQLDAWGILFSVGGDWVNIMGNGGGDNGYEIAAWPSDMTSILEGSTAGSTPVSFDATAVHGHRTARSGSRPFSEEQAIQLGLAFVVILLSLVLRLKRALKVNSLSPICLASSVSKRASS